MGGGPRPCQPGRALWQICCKKNVIKPAPACRPRCLILIQHPSKHAVTAFLVICAQAPSPRISNRTRRPSRRFSRLAHSQKIVVFRRSHPMAAQTTAQHRKSGRDQEPPAIHRHSTHACARNSTPQHGPTPRPSKYCCDCMFFIILFSRGGVTLKRRCTYRLSAIY